MMMVPMPRERPMEARKVEVRPTEAVPAIARPVDRKRPEIPHTVEVVVTMAMMHRAVRQLGIRIGNRVWLRRF